jgi:DNA-binding GntR family transcriptional regulator
MAVQSLRQDSVATRADEVYGRLREDIVRGVLRPNERLVEAELAERLQVSRTPVRESLQRLAADGLIVSRRRGWIVREHTASEISQIYAVRMALEGMASRLAAQSADPALRRLLQDQQGEDRRQLAAAGARDHLVAANDAFHMAIYRAAGNQRLLTLIQSNRDFYFNYRIARLYTDAEASASLEGHDRIAEALLAGDGDAAEVATREHLAEALAVTLRKLSLG